MQRDHTTECHGPCTRGPCPTPDACERSEVDDSLETLGRIVAVVLGVTGGLAVGYLIVQWGVV